jgi:SPP1 gp7 family putative phage head morphogenesis protein
MNLSEFWTNEEKELLAILLPLLEESARAGIAGVPLQFNRNLANQQAGRWARQYTDELLRILGTSQRRVVGQVLENWTQQRGADMGSLVSALKQNFDAQRADLIAVTEVTRAYAHGNKIAYQQSGVTHWRWRTNRDALTCKVCAPLNNQVFAIGEVIGNFRGTPFTEPPAHPGCRCWMTPVVNAAHPLVPRRDAQDVIPIGNELLPANVTARWNFLDAIDAMPERSVKPVGVLDSTLLSGITPNF